MSAVMLCLCVCVCMAITAMAQGTVGIRDHDKSKQIELQSMKVDCKVASRFAHTTMTTKAFNVANDSKEVFFDVDLPKTAFITNFTIEIEGQVYISEVKEKEKARQQYEKAVSSGQSAGLVKAFGRHMEKFSVSVNVAAQSLVTFTLTYEELLRRRLGSYEIMIGVRPKQLVQNFEIVVDIDEPQGITFVDINSTFITNELLPLVEKEVTVKKAHVYFSPTLDQQRQCPDCKGTLIDGDFLIKYDVNHAKDIGEIQIVNGYFVHFFAPENLPQIPKNVVFVIDRSGSMDGEKMKQTREALLTILSDLHKDDYFGLVTFDDVIESWRPLLSKATPENVTAAKKFVKTITARHFTDINKAVLHAVDMLTAEQSESLPDTSMIILLTDGRPSAGEQDLSIIQKNVHDAINGSLSLFCLGFGNDLDYSLLDTMAKQNDGLARRIYEGSDATLQLQGFYEEVASPLLLEVNLSYPGDTVTSLTDSHFKHFFEGSEIVVAGRLKESEIDNFMTEVSAIGLEEQFVVKGLVINEERDSVFPDQEYIFGDFMEHLWAYLTIQQLLDKRDKCSPDEKDNITAEALDLSLRYHFVTPLTSMVVTKPQTGDEETLIADKLTEDEREDITESDLMSSGVVVQNSWMHRNWNAQDLSVMSVRAPPGSMSSRRKLKHSFLSYADGDPHFIIELPDQNDALCFNFDDKPGTIFNLVRDPLTGIVVNGQIIGDKKEVLGVKMHTYFGSFGIVHEQLGVKLMVSTKEISVSEEGKHAKLLWSITRTVKGRSINLQVIKDQSLTVTLKDSVKFLIILHKVWKNHPYHQDYLGFYTLDSHLLSKSVHGLLGQFYHGVNFEVSGLIPGTDPGKQDAIMFVKGNKLTVTRGLKKDFRQDVKNGENVPCWFIHNNGNGLLDGLHTDYIMSDLFKTI